VDSGQLNSLLKRLCKTLWEAQVTNPITYVTQLSYLIFLKMLEEMDMEQKEIGNGNHKSLFGDTGSHIEVKKRLLDRFDLQAVVTLPKGMFEPYTPNPTCFFVFENTGKPAESVWFYRLEGDGSTLTKARKFGPQYRNDFPDLLAKWRERIEEPGRAWRVPAQAIRDRNYNMTLSGLGLIEPEKTEHDEPEEILERVAEKQERILELVEEMRNLLLDERL